MQQPIEALVKSSQFELHPTISLYQAIFVDGLMGDSSPYFINSAKKLLSHTLVLLWATKDPSQITATDIRDVMSLGPEAKDVLERAYASYRNNAIPNEVSRLGLRLAIEYFQDVMDFTGDLPTLDIQGTEADALINGVPVLTSQMASSGAYFLNTGIMVARKAISIAKRVHGNNASMEHISDLLLNRGGRGEFLLTELRKIQGTPGELAENRELVNFFLNDYYSELKGMKHATKTFEHSAGLRTYFNRHSLKGTTGIQSLFARLAEV